MKHAYRTLMGLGLAALAPLSFSAQEPAATPAAKPAAEATKAAKPTHTPEQVKEVFSYYIGYTIGTQLAMQFGSLDADVLNQDSLFKGVTDATSGERPSLTEEQIREYVDDITAMLKERDAARTAANKKAGEEFLAANKKKKGVVTTESGLQYKILKEGTGRKYDADKDGGNALCSITYEGRLVDGSVFDSSDKPFDMPINQVVPGFSEALKLMPIGSEWEVYIPGELAYGDNPYGKVGNGATLIFKIKLVAIKAGQGTSDNPIELTPEMLQQLQEQGLQPVQEDAAPTETPATEKK